MTSFEIGRLAYLGLLGAALLLIVLVQYRGRMGQMMQQAAIWGLIFIGAIAAVGLWDDITRSSAQVQALASEEGRITVPRARDGHYYLTLSVNDEPVRFVVDTGASAVVLKRADAARAGIDLDALRYFGQAFTANGPVATAPVQLDSIGLGPIQDRNLRAWVNQGEMEHSLLGMEYLQRFGRIEITGGELILTR